MQGFLKKISPLLVFLLGACLALIFEHTIFGSVALRGQVPSLVLLFLCLSLFYTAGSFWFWCFRIFTAGFLIEMTGSTLPGLKLALVFFCGMAFKYLLTLVSRRSVILFVCLFSTLFLVVEGIPLAVCLLLEHAASLSLYAFYALGVRLVYSILLAVSLSYVYARFFRD